jgi:transposase
VGKATIVVFDSRASRTRTVANTLEALSALVLTFEPTCLIICESTGGYEATLLQAALIAGRPAHRACARKVKAFIRSFGTLGKTDAIDARALAAYGTDRHARLARWQAPDQSRDRLQALVLTRRDLVAQRQATANRLQAPGAEPVITYLQAVIDCLESQIKTLDRDIATLISSQPALAKADAALQAIAGFGPKTAAGLIALMPELGQLNRRQAAALAGLAPHPIQSGTVDRYRPVRGGRPEVKRLLFMAAMVAAKSNPDLKTFYQRLCQAGKKPIVALTAVMRKLVIIANATIRDAENKPAEVS